jgi:putative nucleotidyltransferase with HDIG domain
MGQGLAGQAALERKMVVINDLTGKSNSSFNSPELAAEGFVTYIGVPLIAKGEIVGVLEIFQREKLEPEKDWLNFLETLAGQAAIAIDSSTLFNNLQRSNLELSLAYDATLLGWSNALDLRDKETEGHSQRVMEMTLQLARRLEFNDEELIPIRRGALLHDIGKMGVPDSILNKPGPLTEEEWASMRKHPQLAYDLLSPISYLHKALDIPYCHHEKWDGTGYPRGLKGEQIPLSARIFAVVDVWDALTSDRPYRKAWTDKKALKHIQEQAGKHFDAQVVKIFLELDIPKNNKGE